MDNGRITVVDPNESSSHSGWVDVDIAGDGSSHDLVKVIQVAASGGGATLLNVFVELNGYTPSADVRQYRPTLTRHADHRSLIRLQEK